MPLKTCPKCGAGNGPRRNQCECGYSFRSGKIEAVVAKPPPSPAPTRTESSKGYKQCGECGVFVPIRVVVCVCGHDFKKIPQVKTVEKPKQVDDSSKAVIERIGQQQFFSLSIVAPAGECPVPLRGNSVDEVAAWVFKLIEHHNKNNERLTIQALRMYVKQFYDFWTKEYQDVDAVLRTILEP